MDLRSFFSRHFQTSAGPSSHTSPPRRGITTGLLILNFCMYFIVMAIAASVINSEMNNESPSESEELNHLSITDFSIGNAATGFFVLFALIAGVLGVASTIAGTYHNYSWNAFSMPFAASIAFVAWTLTFLAMGFACKEIELKSSTGPLRAMEAFLIILTITQFSYLFLILHIHRAPSVVGV